MLGTTPVSHMDNTPSCRAIFPTSAAVFHPQEFLVLRFDTGGQDCIKNVPVSTTLEKRQTTKQHFADLKQPKDNCSLKIYDKSFDN